MKYSNLTLTAAAVTAALAVGTTAQGRTQTPSPRKT